jgi:hypothetical protein
MTSQAVIRSQAAIRLPAALRASGLRALQLVCGLA